jgi:hypothetical protein
MRKGYLVLVASLILGLLGTLATVHVDASSTNVTVVHNVTTTNAVLSSINSFSGQLTAFYEQHKALVLISLAFLFVVILAVLLMKR